MTQYATTADLAALGLPAAALAGVLAATQNEHLLKQGGKIDTYLRAHHTLPLSSPFPDSIIDCNAVMAAYTILQNFRGYSPDEFDSGFRERYDDCIEFLKDLAAGRASLGTDADATAAREGAPKVSTGGNDALYGTGTAGAPRGW